MHKARYKRYFIVYPVLILAIAVSFLFSPRPPDNYDPCVRYISLTSRAGFVYNCDASHYCLCAAHPSHLLGPKGPRQSRPLYLLTGTVIGYPIQCLVDKMNIPLFHKLGEEAASYVGYYMAYTVINFLMLLLSLYLLERIIDKISGGRFNHILFLSACIFLVSNIITKAFFWTAHQQFFSLVTPLLTIYLLLRIREDKRHLGKMMGLSLLCGVLMLFYGNFIPMFLCLIVGAFCVDKKLHFPAMLLNGSLFILPTAVWMLICIYKTGYYYNREIEEYRQLVWVKDSISISISNFLRVLWMFIREYATTFRQLLFFIIGALATTMVRPKGNEEEKYAEQIMYLSFGVFFLFFLMLGFYAERLSFTLYPILLGIIFLNISRIPQLKKMPYAFLCMAVCWHIYNVCSFGPFC